MSLLDVYPKKTVVWGAKGPVNEYNEPTFTDTSIEVTWFESKKIIRQEGREDVVCDAYCLADSAIQEGDRITKDGISWPVLSVDFTEGFLPLVLRVVNLSKNQA